MKVIPAGTSKRTGRPYKAFETCDTCKPSRGSLTPQPVKQPIDWDKIRDEKRENISAEVAKKIAGEIIASSGTAVFSSHKDEFEKWARFINDLDLNEKEEVEEDIQIPF
jgi:hypothetical protein